MRRSSGAGGEPRVGERLALVVAVDRAEPLPQPVGKIGGDRVGKLRGETRLELAQPRARRRRRSRRPSSRMPMPSSRTSTASARCCGRCVCASASSERRRRKYANTPSAMNARSCCPIALCWRKKSCSSESAGARAAGSRRSPRRAPRSGSPAGPVECLRASRSGIRRLGAALRAHGAAVIAGRAVRRRESNRAWPRAWPRRRCDSW